MIKFAERTSTEAPIERTEPRTNAADGGPHIEIGDATLSECLSGGTLQLHAEIADRRMGKKDRVLRLNPVWTVERWPYHRDKISEQATIRASRHAMQRAVLCQRIKQRQILGQIVVR